MSSGNITELKTEEYGGASFLMNSQICGLGDIDGVTTPTMLGEKPIINLNKQPVVLD